MPHTDIALHLLGRLLEKKTFPQRELHSEPVREKTEKSLKADFSLNSV